MDLLERRWFFEGMINRITILLFLSVGFSQKEYDINHIVEQNGGYQVEVKNEKEDQEEGGPPSQS